VRRIGWCWRAVRDQKPFDLAAARHRRTGGNDDALKRNAGFACANAATGASRGAAGSAGIHFDVEQSAARSDRNRSARGRNRIQAALHQRLAIEQRGLFSGAAGQDFARHRRTRRLRRYRRVQQDRSCKRASSRQRRDRARAQQRRASQRANSHMILAQGPHGAPFAPRGDAQSINLLMN